jgi:hypothetical protein
VLLKGGKEPLVETPRQAGIDLGTALQEMMAQIPDYEMQVVAPRLIVIFPRNAKDDPEDVLNLQVADFSVTNKPATVILSDPEGFIPELQARLSPEHPQPANGILLYSGPYTPPALRITLHLQNVTVRQILDAVVLATEQIPADDLPAGWICLVNSDNTPGVLRHAFNLQGGVPANWREYRSSGQPSK